MANSTRHVALFHISGAQAASPAADSGQGQAETT